MAGQKQPTAKKAPAIVIEAAYQGGIADSPYAGMKNSLYSIVGFDVNSVPGLMIGAQKLTKIPNCPTDDLYKIVSCSDGNIYLFGKTLGNVYRSDGVSTFTLLGTVAPAAGAVGVLDALEWNGFLYYMMQSRMGRWDFTTAFSTRNDSYQTFLVTNATYHPSMNLNEVLYIGDGNNVAQFDGTTFTGNALVLKTPQIISALGRQVTDLLIGTIIPNGVPKSYAYRWNTWSVSYTNAYPVPEVGVNLFIQAGDSDVVIQAGLSGNLYRLAASQFDLIRQVPPNFPTLYTPSNQAQAYYPAFAVLQGIPLFGFSNVSGNPSNEGIYSYGSRTSSYPTILTLPYPVSTGNLTGIQIWSLSVQGTNLFVSSFDSGMATYQIDKLDYSNKFNGSFFETRVIKFSRIWLDIFKKIVVNYQALPASTAINLFFDANWAGYIQYAANDIFVDTDRNEVVGNLQPRAKTMRFKVQTTASGNNAPTIEDVVILPE